MQILFSQLLIALGDLVSIFIAQLFAILLAGETWENTLSQVFQPHPIYIILLGIFTYEGFYRHHYDFWQESRRIIRALVLAFVMLGTYLAFAHQEQSPTQSSVILTFLLLFFLIPFNKRWTKILLHHLGTWKKPVHVYGKDPHLENELYGNPYLGYRASQEGEHTDTLIILASEMPVEELHRYLESVTKHYREILFVPYLNDYDLTLSNIYELTNARSNLISLENRLRSPFSMRVKASMDLLVGILILPFILPLLALIAWWIHREDPEGKIFFLQKRLGKDGKVFTCYKFRTMYENSESILQQYLKEHPEEKEHYQRYHKYMHDPRITPSGRFLRATSLDELPQILNVLRREMSLVGPRPYMLSEKKDLGDFAPSILSVHPGITGLWQVSGRNRLDFAQRIDMDLWYIRNWSLWLDIVILLKTAKSVWKREGAG